MLGFGGSGALIAGLYGIPHDQITYPFQVFIGIFHGA
jgi:hypothetical protein